MGKAGAQTGRLGEGSLGLRNTVDPRCSGIASCRAQPQPRLQAGHGQATEDKPASQGLAGRRPAQEQLTLRG